MSLSQYTRVISGITSLIMAIAGSACFIQAKWELGCLFFILGSVVSIESTVRQISEDK